MVLILPMSKFDVWVKTHSGAGCNQIREENTDAGSMSPRIVGAPQSNVPSVPEYNSLCDPEAKAAAFLGLC